MDFILSKALWLAVNPGNLLLILLAIGVLLLFSRRFAALGRRLAAFSTLILLILSFLPLGRWLFVPLESRFPQAEPPAQVAGIVVLGGFVDTVLSHKTGRVELGGAVERLFALIELASRYPQARVIFSGGSGSVLHPEASEAPLVQKLLTELGFDASRVTFEAKSRNTHENALLSKELAKPGAGETWLLVTSAAHMPRAVGCFRAQDWPVTAWPVDFLTDGSYEAALDFNLAGRIGLLGSSLHEWLGLVSYYMMGRTSDLFPAP
ncbi:MAG: YdcF family protein [Alphaproteobacteria bacterium]|nr:YdcF family protein [Alphaproteobacteria bacterium]